jgi:protein-disulfide isomerase
MLPPFRGWILCLPAVLLLCLTGAGQSRAAAGRARSALDKPTLEAYIRHLYGWGPDIKLEIADAKPSELPGMRQVSVRASAGGQSVEQLWFVSRDGKKMIQGTVYDIGRNPFQADLSKLSSLSGPALGTPGAPVVVVLFTDFQCPYCRQQARTVRENLIAAYPKQVRLYFADFPLEEIHPWAKAAAIAGRCVYQQGDGAFWQYHDWVFAEQERITPENLRAKVMEFAQNHQLETLGLGRCIDTRATEAQVDDSLALARSLKVDATPTLFINGRRIAAQISWPQLKALIDNELEYQKTAGHAGEQACCEVSLPSPLAK